MFFLSAYAFIHGLILSFSNEFFTKVLSMVQYKEIHEALFSVTYVRKNSREKLLESKITTFTEPFRNRVRLNKTVNLVLFDLRINGRQSYNSEISTSKLHKLSF